MLKTKIIKRMKTMVIIGGEKEKMKKYEDAETKREYTDKEIEVLAIEIIARVREKVKQEYKDYDSVDLDYEIERAWEAETDFGRAENWKWHTDADKEKLDELLDKTRVAEIVYDM